MHTVEVQREGDVFKTSLKVIRYVCNNAWKIYRYKHGIWKWNKFKLMMLGQHTILVWLVESQGHFPSKWLKIMLSPVLTLLFGYHKV